MQLHYLGGIGDFGKFALLRHLMKDRRLAVCCYLTGGKYETKDRERHFDYLKRPEDFRHFAPEVFDRLAAFDGGVVDPLSKTANEWHIGERSFPPQGGTQTGISAPAVGPRTCRFGKQRQPRLP